MPSSHAGRRAILPALVAVALMVLVAAAARSPRHEVPGAPDPASLTEARRQVAAVDAFFERRWQESSLPPAELADDLTILRRLSLSLIGTVPSLEEIRRFEQDTAPNRLERWTIQITQDRRFADYFARRLARSFIGADVGQFILFRRDRFTNWLADQLHDNRPMDEVVREMIASKGLWTGQPATNYITQAVVDGTLDPNKLAGRTVRAFLGQRIDCAQCHNHPFAEWKQHDFEGLAACYAQIRIAATGVEDDVQRKFEVEDRTTLETRTVAPQVPFGQEWWPAEGSLREQLAGWVTHADNRRFERAMVNRVWGLMFGRAWHEPVDDLPNPSATPDPEKDLLDLLGADFRAHGCDLKRLIGTIAATRAFRLSSQHPSDENAELAESIEQNWAAFPLVRLRPEQVIGSMLQASTIKTIDQNSHLITRILKFFRENDFVKEYGDLGEQELDDRTGTIPQALLRMNGRFAREVSEASPFSAAGRIAGMAPNDDACIETVFLCCLARRPTTEEVAFFRDDLSGSKQQSRGDVVEDLFWTLFNSPEFCWNH